MLTSTREGVTGEYLIKSILQPSADILKGYQSVNVITVDGAAISGFLVEQDDDNITLSISAEKGKHRVIPQDDAEEIIESNVSTMPAGLAASLKSREEFLDLAKFVLEINQGGDKVLKSLKKEAKVKSK